METCVNLVADLNSRIQTAFGTVLMLSAWKVGVAGLLASVWEMLVVRQTWADK